MTEGSRGPGSSASLQPSRRQQLFHNSFLLWYVYGGFDKSSTPGIEQVRDATAAGILRPRGTERAMERYGEVGDRALPDRFCGMLAERQSSLLIGSIRRIHEARLAAPVRSE